MTALHVSGATTGGSAGGKRSPASSASKSRPLDASTLATLHAIPGNDACADCFVSHPQWASVSHGTLICLKCSGAHRGLGTHISFVRSLTLDDWTDSQIALMLAGGNDKCNEFLEDEGIIIDCMTGEREEIRPKYGGEEGAAWREELRHRAFGGSSAGNANRPSSSSPAQAVRVQGQGAAAAAPMPPQPITLGDPVNPPKPSDYHEIVYHMLLGRKGWGKTKIGLILMGSGALAFKYLPRMLTQYQPNMVRLACAAILTIPVVAVNVLVRKVSGALVANRLPAFKSAGNTLLDRMRSGRALRKKGYDVFLPDFSLNGGKREVEIGFVLIPGALVDPLAYATIAAKLSDEGILVAVMNTEPQRLPTEKTGAGKVKVLTIMYDIIAGMSDGTNFGLATVKQWAVGGHSMGAFQAFEVIGDLKPDISKLVMWGIGKPDELATEVNLHDATVDALVIVGPEDVFYQQLSEEDRNAFFSKLPKTRTTFLEIEGGNHSGFAHYGPQTFPLKDGERSITLDEQQDDVVAATITFLVGEDGSKLKKQ